MRCSRSRHPALTYRGAAGQGLSRAGWWVGWLWAGRGRGSGRKPVPNHQPALTRQRTPSARSPCQPIPSPLDTSQVSHRQHPANPFTPPSTHNPSRPRTGIRSGRPYSPATTLRAKPGSRASKGYCPNSMAYRMMPADQMSARCGAQKGVGGQVSHNGVLPSHPNSMAYNIMPAADQMSARCGEGGGQMHHNGYCHYTQTARH